MKTIKICTLFVLCIFLTATVCVRWCEANVEPEIRTVTQTQIIEIEKPVEVEVVKAVDITYTPAVRTENDLTPDMICSLPMFDQACAMMAQLSYAEQTYAPAWFCNQQGTDGTELIAAVDWCVCNRCDNKELSELISKITAPYQFAYSPSTVIDSRHYEIARDVITRWLVGDYLISDGRVLPEEYEWFGANGDETNAFRDAYKGGNRWDWSLESPYCNE